MNNEAILEDMHLTAKSTDFGTFYSDGKNHRAFNIDYLDHLDRVKFKAEFLCSEKGEVEKIELSTENEVVLFKVEIEYTDNNDVLDLRIHKLNNNEDSRATYEYIIKKCMDSEMKDIGEITKVLSYIKTIIRDNLKDYNVTFEYTQKVKDIINDFKL